MGHVIRKNKEQYLSELKQWLAETEGEELEEMDGFFARCLEGYEKHMSVWEKAYRRFAELLPGDCRKVLDLGCGTGLELQEIWEKNPELAVTGVDLCQSMLNKLGEKYGDKALQLVCMDYFRYEMGTGSWDAVLSFESLHHFLPDKKRMLYQKINRSLKENGLFILGDYIACCEEEEELLRRAYLEKRQRSNIAPDRFVHFDIPLTLEHEETLLREAGFSDIMVADSLEGATLLTARK